jgi:hypothetical protein
MAMRGPFDLYIKHSWSDYTEWHSTHGSVGAAMLVVADIQQALTVLGCDKSGTKFSIEFLGDAKEAPSNEVAPLTVGGVA